jgi:hypothetical protein
MNRNVLTGKKFRMEIRKILSPFIKCLGAACFFIADLPEGFYDIIGDVHGHFSELKIC